jgi:type I restriction enzyme S subunit
VQKGDFIYSRLFAWRGAFGVIPDDLDGCYVSGEFPTFNAIPEKIDAFFLLYWFRLPATIAQVDKNCSGSTPLTRNRFKEHFFLPLEIPLPPLQEQRRIVARIDELSSLIDEVRVLRERIVKETNSFVLSVHSYLSGNRTRKIGDILYLDEEPMPVLAPDPYPQIGVRSFGGGLFKKTAVLGAETTYRSFNRLYEGALVLSQVKGWEGAIAACPPEMAGWFVSPEYRTFRCKLSEARPGYLSSLVRTEWFWGKLKNATRGVGARRERTRPEQFLNIEIPMPTIEKQQLGEDLFCRLTEIKHFQDEADREMESMLPAIIDRAFRGELFVST